MRQRVQEEVPDEGIFEVFYEMIKNTDDSLYYFTNIDLRVTSIPKHLENSATNITSKILITKLSTNATVRLLYVLSMNSMSICTRQCSNSRE